MSKVDSEDGWILFVVGVALAAFIVWKFSPYLGLDLATGGLVLARLAVLVVLTGLSWKVADDFPPLAPGAVWPLLLSLLWLCWWPALDFWAAKGLPPGLVYEDDLPWWDTWYTKWGALVGIAAWGYLIKKVFDSDSDLHAGAAARVMASPGMRRRGPGLLLEEHLIERPPA